MHQRTRIGMIAFVVAAVLGLIIVLTPAQYVIVGPGGIYDTLGTVRGEDNTDAPVVSVPGATTYPTDGELDVLTVGVRYTPEQLPSWFAVIQSWIDPMTTPVPIEAYYPKGLSTEDVEEQNLAMMRDSQNEAMAAALRAIEQPFTVTVSVAELLDGSPAEGLLQPGDVITAVDGQAVTSGAGLSQMVRNSTSGAELTLDILRDGKKQQVAVTPRLNAQGAQIIGVALKSDYQFPYQFNVELGAVGGPSAGLVLALAFYDKLTPHSLTGGQRVAATGTINAEGVVGPIGGIGHKLNGAAQDGIRWVLIPEANCAEVRGNIPGSVQAVTVSTLDDAIRAVRAIGTGIGTDVLPRC